MYCSWFFLHIKDSLYAALWNTSRSVDPLAFNLSLLEVQISLYELQFANELQECLSVLERPTHIRQSLQLPQDSLAPPMCCMCCISSAPPRLVGLGGVRELQELLKV